MASSLRDPPSLQKDKNSDITGLWVILKKDEVYEKNMIKVKKYYKSNPQFSESSCIEPTCPIEFLLEIIGHKWSIQILRELFIGSRRTHELLAALPGISTKTLTLRLRQLQQHDLVKRTVYPEIPPHVEYTLTEKGRELKPILIALKQVGQTWLQQQPCTCPLELSG